MRWFSWIVTVIASAIAVVLYVDRADRKGFERGRYFEEVYRRDYFR